ncbi:MULTISPECIES: hypothetical protein [unclassified Xanthomonas]|uniref:hypothetical protein n=1 Tax=unclassified Xanthomonas TaxID=2643310 RepID=UPI002882DEE6|nr:MULTISPECIES: hypothetical protein [unclassified Xanthomonas]
MAEIIVNKAIIFFFLALTSCGLTSKGEESDSEYRKFPTACSAEAYLKGLSRYAKARYIFGALHSRPQAACIVYLISKQDVEFLIHLKDEVSERGEMHDHLDFLSALVLKKENGQLAEKQIQRLQLKNFCSGIEDADGRCVNLLRRLD